MAVRQHSPTPAGMPGPKAHADDSRHQGDESSQQTAPVQVPDEQTTAGASPSEGTRRDPERARRLGYRTDPSWFLG